MRRTFALGGLALAVLAAGSGVAVLALRDDSPAAVQVRLAAAQRGQVTAVVSAAGSTVDGSRRDLAFGASGTVTKVYVKTGTKVKKGQVLARIDGREAREAYEAAKADLAASEEALDKASTATATDPPQGTTTSTSTSTGTSTTRGGTNCTPAGGKPSTTVGTTASDRPAGAPSATPTTGRTGGGTATRAADPDVTPGAEGPAGGGLLGPVRSPGADHDGTSSPAPEPTRTSRPTVTPTTSPTGEPTGPEPQPTVTVTATVTATVTVTATATAQPQPQPQPQDGGTRETDGPAASGSPPAKPSATKKQTATGKPSARPSTGSCLPSTGRSAGPSTGGTARTGAGDARRTSEDQAAANVDRAEAALEEAADAVRATRIVAPAAGTVLSVAGAPGDRSGTGTFISLGDLDELQVQAMATESDVNRLKLGQRAGITLATRPGERYPGTVTAIAPTATRDGRLVRYPVTLAFDEPPTGLMLGQTASVTVTTDTAADAIYVPAAAVRGRPDGAQVVTVRSGGRDVAKVVETGVRGDQYVEVTSGLTERDQVVISDGTTGEFPDGSWPDA
ncbi:Macrolide export protein MacA [Nonomuraea coxensis DSM 45129]|uniref:Macrolide export protein MacA n=1 Tax=Nonomuraea coxensis DSM 45129 TaxID=1122611 RepID=A0ABX8U038_9ACTN|nr:efflux RND transporter periplasmic adaptor subunit [Nonomuraea coxensis]QYC41107.1 Macrolide export protein MacA [Nonomuraea coxensis DSM 45129]